MSLNANRTWAKIDGVGLKYMHEKNIIEYLSWDKRWLGIRLVSVGSKTNRCVNFRWDSQFVQQFQWDSQFVQWDWKGSRVLGDSSCSGVTHREPRHWHSCIVPVPFCTAEGNSYYHNCIRDLSYWFHGMYVRLNNELQLWRTRGLRVGRVILFSSDTQKKRSDILTLHFLWNANWGPTQIGGNFSIWCLFAPRNFLIPNSRSPGNHGSSYFTITSELQWDANIFPSRYKNRLSDKY